MNLRCLSPMLLTLWCKPFETVVYTATYSSRYTLLTYSTFVECNFPF